MNDEGTERLIVYSNVVTEVENILDAYSYEKAPQPMKFLLDELRSALQPLYDDDNAPQSPETSDNPANDS